MKFLSKYRNHKLIVEPTRMIVQDGMAYSQPGKMIEFHDFSYETTDKKEISFLRGHKLFGSTVFEDKQPTEGAGE
jgi:hypothetical protein